MFPPIFLPSPELEIEGVEVDEAAGIVQLKVCSRSKKAVCPDCGQPSERIHSWYERRLQDVPCGGFGVQIVVEVRRFFCDGEACRRKTFAEQIASVTGRYARRTNRLGTLVQAVALLVGSSMGKRILGLLQISVSVWSMLRVLRQIPAPSGATPRVLGVDDWAMRRGRRYGTVLVDLERSVVVDLLPDREAQTLATWLRAHPGVEIISRDRAEDYAEGARQGAPDAMQVADRWHLLKNLGEMLVRVLSGHQRELRQLAQWLGTDPLAQGRSETVASSAEPLSVPPSPSASRRNQQFAEAHALHDQGFSITAIARRTGLDRKTVRTYLGQTTLSAPQRTKHARLTKLAPYEAYLLEHWAFGQRTVRQLYQDIRQQGYTGCLSVVAEFMSEVRKAYGLRPFVRRDQLLPGPPHPTAQLSPRTAAWLLLAQPEDLTRDNDRALAAALPGLHPAIAQAAHAAQRFAHLVRTRTVDGFDDWLAEMHQSSLPLLRAFARSLQHDYAAVRAALSLSWNNGPVEGHVNHLKFVKRQMFGRANFDLLRIRVLAFPP